MANLTLSLLLAIALAIMLAVATFQQTQPKQMIMATFAAQQQPIIDLNQPLYMEHFKIIGQKEVVTVNGTKVTEEIFSGNGTVKGISVTSSGKSLIIPRPEDVIYVKGKADLIAVAADDRQTGKATYTYEAIGNYGVALFDANATGNLSFLSNTIGVYKVDINENGTNTFTMWKWGIN
jgi:hypothetical protein